VRVWPDGTSEYLGRPSYDPAYAQGTRDVVSARIGFSPPGGKPFEMEATPLLPVHPDGRHRLRPGTGLEARHVPGTGPRRPGRRLRPVPAGGRGPHVGMVDAVGRFGYDGQTGYGLYEYWALGDHPSFR